MAEGEVTKDLGVCKLLFLSRVPLNQQRLRRKRAIVSSFDFLLDEGATAKALICVVEVDPANPKNQTTTNYEIRRGNYQEAVKKSAKVIDVKEAGRKAKETDSIVESVCADLGVK